MHCGGRGSAATAARVGHGDFPGGHAKTVAFQGDWPRLSMCGKLRRFPRMAMGGNGGGVGDGEAVGGFGGVCCGGSGWRFGCYGRCIYLCAPKMRVVAVFRGERRRRIVRWL